MSVMKASNNQPDTFDNGAVDRERRAVRAARRDAFAAAALTAILSGYNAAHMTPVDSHTHIATHAVRYADAMLAALDAEAAHA